MSPCFRGTSKAEGVTTTITTMKNISLNIDKVTGFVTREQIMALEPQVKSAQKALEEGTLPGNDFLGWLHLPSSITKEDIADKIGRAHV